MSYNPKKDYLKQDPVFPGQDYVVVSFLNPKDKVLCKQLHYINSFLINDVNKSITAQAIQMVRKLQVDMRSKISDLLDKLKYSLDEEDKVLSRLLETRYREMNIDEDQYVEECRRRYELDEEELLDRYKIYLSSERTRMDREYDDAHDDETSLRGVKVRGSFARLDDARDRAKFMRDTVEPGIHAYVVPVGVWFPIDVEADEVQDQDYMLPQLNELMGKYHEGTHARNLHYQERKREMEEDAGKDKRSSVKSRLQETLRQRKNQKMRSELEEFEKLTKKNTTNDETGIKKKKKRSRKQKADNETATTE